MPRARKSTTRTSRPAPAGDVRSRLIDAAFELAASKGYSSTPTIVVSGPKGEAQPIVGDTDYGSLESAIKSVT